MLLFTVQEIFTLTGMGLILTPGPSIENNSIKIGSKIKLIRPDKSEINTIITGWAWNDRRDIFIESKYSKEDVPIGTEVWLNE
jgi:hypothetical protein